MLTVLTIAGSDSSGGAGVQADLKTFHALGVFGVCALTAVTVQNTQKVYSVHDIPSSIVRDQILCLFDDIPIRAVKIGMVSSPRLISAISEVLRSVADCPIILDPVMISKSGYPLSSSEARAMMISELIPVASVITPNLYEAEIITGDRIMTVVDMKVAARKICDMGVKSVVVKGGHLSGSQATDVVLDGNKFGILDAQRLRTSNTHGTGCTFSSAVTAYMASGFGFFEAATLAKKYITGAISDFLDIGKGCGPVNHFFDLYKRAGLSV